LGTIQNGESQRCEERWAAAWWNYSRWPQTVVSIDEGAVGGEKES